MNSRDFDKTVYALRLVYRVGMLLVVGSLAAVAVTARAADFSVSPMIVEFQRGVRSAEIQVRNLDKQPIRFQIRATDWSQDASGKNIYADSKSLIWFPRAIELAPDESRIIRVGIRALPATQEQAYMIFITEVPLEGSRPEKAQGAQVQIILSVSVPIFVPPARAQPGGAVESIELSGGSLNVVVANAGNRHFSYREAVVVGVDSEGAEKFRQTVRGKTLLAGSRHSLEVRIPSEACRQLRELALTLTTSEKSAIKRRLDVSRAECE